MTVNPQKGDKAPQHFRRHHSGSTGRDRTSHLGDHRADSLDVDLGLGKRNDWESSWASENPAIILAIVAVDSAENLVLVLAALEAVKEPDGIEEKVGVLLLAMLSKSAYVRNFLTGRKWIGRSG